jgi:hypothetical protein
MIKARADASRELLKLNNSLLPLLPYRAIFVSLLFFLKEGLPWLTIFFLCSLVLHPPFIGVAPRRPGVRLAFFALMLHFFQVPLQLLPPIAIYLYRADSSSRVE